MHTGFAVLYVEEQNLSHSSYLQQKITEDTIKDGLSKVKDNFQGR